MMRMFHIAALLHILCVAFLAGVPMLYPFVVAAQQSTPAPGVDSVEMTNIVARVYLGGRHDLNGLAGNLVTREVLHKDVMC